MQRVKLVIGYVPAVDRLPSEAERRSLTHRFAVVLDSHRESSADDFFDVALYVRFVDIVRKVVGAETIRVVLSSYETREVSTAEELRQMLEKTPDALPEPFQRLVLLKEGVTVAIVESEPWAHVGGPEPYHDSYTLAVFTGSDRSSLLMRESHALCETTGAYVTEIVRADPCPLRRGILDAIQKTIRALFGER